MSQPAESAPGAPAPLQRLGRNVDRYLGETIEIEPVLRDIESVARRSGWAVDEFLRKDHLRLMAIRRPAQKQSPLFRVYLSAGIHGDEPAGPLAIRGLLEKGRWPAEMEFWVCPCLNPAGFLLNRRENAAGTDLNRQYLQPEADETLAHIEWLKQQPRFDLALCLHEDWESAGFYLYELNPDEQPSLADGIMDAVKQVCPIDLTEIIEGRSASNGIIRPNLDPRSRPQWPEAFYLLMYHTSLTYTFEAPSDFPLGTRVAALEEAVAGALEQLKRIRAKGNR